MQRCCPTKLMLILSATASNIHLKLVLLTSLPHYLLISLNSSPACPYGYNFSCLIFPLSHYLQLKLHYQSHFSKPAPATVPIPLPSRPSLTGVTCSPHSLRHGNEQQSPPAGGPQDDRCLSPPLAPRLQLHHLPQRGARRVQSRHRREDLRL